MRLLRRCCLLFVIVAARPELREAGLARQWRLLSQEVERELDPVPGDYVSDIVADFWSSQVARCRDSAESFFTPCVDATSTPNRLICGESDGGAPVCDVYSKGSGMCRWNRWGPEHGGGQLSSPNCQGSWLLPNVSRTFAERTQLYCPPTVPIAVVLVKKSGSSMVQDWLMSMESRYTLDALQEVAETIDSVNLTRIKDAPWRFGFYDTMLKSHRRLRLYHRTLGQAVAAAKAGHYQSYRIELPPHMCLTCCSHATARLPLMVVRNPFQRVAAVWRVLILPMAECRLDEAAAMQLQGRQRALRRLCRWPDFVQYVARVFGPLRTNPSADLMREFATMRATETNKVRLNEEYQVTLDTSPSIWPLEISIVLHLIPVATLLKNAGFSGKQGFVVHLERTEEDLKAASKVLCEFWGHCESLPSMREKRRCIFSPLDVGPQSTENDNSRLQLDWSEPFRKLVAESYAEDFRLFGYDPEQPLRREPVAPPGGWGRAGQLWAA